MIPPIKLIIPPKFEKVFLKSNLDSCLERTDTPGDHSFTLFKYALILLADSHLLKKLVSLLSLTVNPLSLHF